MGCTTSKDGRRSGKSSPFPRRSHSLPSRSVYSKEHHSVISTASTIDSFFIHLDGEMMKKSSNDRPVSPEMIADELSSAKAWSQMMQKRIPKTPSVTPPNEPEIINAWELMEGLGSPLHMSRDDSFVDDFDPEILSSFRKAMEELSPLHQSFLRSPQPQKLASFFRRESVEAVEATGIVKARIKDFQQKIDERRAKAKFSESIGKVVFYFTSIRGVRRTYEDCWSTRVILKGYGVRVDERDVSMDSTFKDELRDALGPGFGGNSLPRVFANGKYLGGAEEVRHLHESGELGKVLEGCELLPVGKDSTEVVCEGCADVRFVPCQTCSGSCKVYVEEEDEDVETGSFLRCPDCNENGLVRCWLCC